MGGEVRYYSVEEAARLLRLTPERVREMAATGQLDSLPPGATEAGDWKVRLPAALGPEHALPSDQAESTADAPENPPVIGSRSMHAATTAKTPGEDAHQPAGELPADTRQTSAEPVSESGWATTEVAAEALGVSPRTVRDYIANGKLDAKPEGEGVERRWLVSIDSVHALRQARHSAARSPRDRHAEPRGGELAAEIAADLMMRVQDLQYKLGRAEARAEITERAESTIREERNRLIDDLERERQRADQERERTQRLEAEREADLTEERRRREEAERQRREAEMERDAARRELETLQQQREEASERRPGPGPATTPPAERAAPPTGVEHMSEKSMDTAAAAAGPLKPPEPPQEPLQEVQRRPVPGRRGLLRRIFRG